MSKFPNQIDDDTTLPAANDNLTQDRAEIINDIRDAVFNIENEIGINAAGTTNSIASRLAVSFNLDGTIKPSAINSLSLDYTQIKIGDMQVLPYAAIQESKLALTYSTQNLFNYATDLSRSVNTALDWIDTTGVKVEPHLAGILYRHTLSEIDVDSNPSNYLYNRFERLRNNTNAYTLIADLNSDYVAHQLADGTRPGAAPTVITESGLSYPSAYAHVANGIFINTSNFAIVPHTANDLQQFAEFIDSANTLLLGTKTQTLFQNGISRSARATALNNNSEGPGVVPPTAAQTFLSTTSPIDSPFPPYGDDIILLSSATGNLLFSQLSAVNPGDIATINYGNVVVSAIVKEVNPTTSTIRIAGKNLAASTSVTVDISRTLDTRNKYGVLATAVAPSPSSSIPPSLIVSGPRGAQTTGIGFNASLFDSKHCNLYLQLYPNGNPNSQIVNLVAIDVTGNQGTTPGAYTLDSVVNNVNTQFRQAGYNFRFIAFEYEGEFGIMLAESYGGASFAILAGVVNSLGVYDPTLTSTLCPNDVVDLINGIDPLGFGPSGANVASPSFTNSFPSIPAALLPTVIISPLQRNFYYVNGGESDRFAVDTQQLVDANGDSYWAASIITKTISGGTIHTTYQVNEDLTQSMLAPGKTIVVQPVASGVGFQTDYGRYTIQDVTFNATCTDDGYVFSTDITVYDAVTGTGISPYLTSGVGTAVNLYFCSDSVNFSTENVNDIDGYTSTVSPFKRHFEIYIDQDGYTFSHERARFSVNATLVNPNYYLNGVQFYVGNTNNINGFSIVDVSPKLTGYEFNTGINVVTKINLQITSYSSTTGIYQGYLRRLNPGLVESFAGPLTTGKVGEVTRFYDATNIDYIDFRLDFNSSAIVPDSYGMDIQLYKSLRLNDELLLLSTCQFNDAANAVTCLEDRRQFGNTSEQQFSDSAVAFINAGNRYTQQNGVVRGFSCLNTTPAANTNTISFSGGLALVNGNFLAVNPFEMEVPIVQDYNGGSPFPGVLFALCVNSQSEMVLLPLTDYNPSVNAVNNPGRLLTFYNLTTTTNYPVDSSVFSTVVNDRKDLTILWLLTMQASTNTTYQVTVQDARKFVTDSSANTPMVVTGGDSQGNFKSLPSAGAWAFYNSTYQNNVIIRGSVTLTSDPGLISGLVISSDGDNCAITFNTTTYSLTGITFNDMTLNFNTAVAIVGCTFNNCTINLGAGGSIDPTVFNNCTINLVSTISLAAATFNKCNINIGYNGLTSAVTTLATGFNIATTASGIVFSKCNITYYPNTSSGYTASNLVNSGFGAIYSSVTSLQNVTIDGCQFTTNTSTRFPFISFEYASPLSLSQNTYITGNNFYNTSAADDIYAVVAFTCLVVTGGQPTEGLKLINCHVDNNTCDKEQLISITGTVDGSQNISTLLVPINTTISGNVCGAISALGASDNERNYLTQTNGIAYATYHGMVVSKNTCRFIGMFSSTGESVISGSAWNNDTLFNNITTNTCTMKVEDNNCSWIHLAPTTTGTSPSLQNSVQIIDNTLRAYNPSFQNPFSYFSGDGNYGIMCIYGGTISSGNVGVNAIINGNTVKQGIYLQNTNATVTYDYATSIVVGGINAIVSDNIFSNILPAGSQADMMIITGLARDVNVNVRGNQFYRNTNAISSYIHYFTGGGNYSVSITDNVFDHFTVSGSYTTSTLNTAPVAALALTYNNLSAEYTPVYGSQPHLIYERNRNQIGFLAVDINQFAWSTSGVGLNGLTYLNGFGGPTGGWNLGINNSTGNQLQSTPVLSLNSVVPAGAQIVYLMTSVIAPFGVGGGGVNNISFTVYAGKSNVFDTSGPTGSFSGSLPDFQSNLGNLSTATYTSNVAAMSTSTNSYAYLNTETYNLVSGSANPTELELVVNMANGTQAIVSQFMVKYIW